jgi:hypothetical protein
LDFPIACWGDYLLWKDNKWINRRPGARSQAKDPHSKFVWRMEDILDIYADTNQAAFPGIGFDEVPYQIMNETRLPLPKRNVIPARHDFEYRQEGTCNLFICLQILAGEYNTSSPSNTRSYKRAEVVGSHLQDIVRPCTGTWRPMKTAPDNFSLP